MRKSFDGLAEATRSVIHSDPLSGHVFVFCNRRRDRIKLLIWDRSGFWIFMKRLEAGTFAWPQESDAASIVMSNRDLMCLLEGIDISEMKLRRRMDRVRSASA